MAVLSTTNFSLPLDELMEESSSRVGGEPITAVEARTFPRLVNLVLGDWQNRGILLWTLEEAVVTVSSSVTSYSLGSDTLDIVSAVYRKNGIDTNMGRLSFDEYKTLPRKNQTGSRATQFYVARNQGESVIYPWPIPDNSSDQIRFWRVRSTKDHTLASDPDVPRRYWPPLVSGCAYYLGMKRPSIPLDRLQMLKMTYEEELQRAMEEDRERASLRISPMMSHL
jgi:hypothetical protein